MTREQIEKIARAVAGEIRSYRLEHEAEFQEFLKTRGREKSKSTELSDIA